MVSVLASRAVDRGFESRSGQTTDYKICRFSTRHAALRRKGQGRFKNIIGPRSKQCTGTLTMQPSTEIKMELVDKIKYTGYIYCIGIFLKNQCLDIKKTCCTYNMHRLA